MADAVRVRAPASSANLGPGFDSFAVALSMHVELEVVRTGSFAVVTELDVERGRDNLAVRGFAALHDPDDFEFRIGSTIPLSGGLGSSAAAIVAGLVAAAAITGSARPLLAEAIRLEGHPDNVAAALRGGFVICAGEREPIALRPPDELAAVLVIPHEAVRTAQAREALPAQVPLADAVVNLCNAASLAIGLERGDLELIAASLHDRLHQPYRAHLYQAAAELSCDARELGALGGTISGAGPTVLLWCERDAAADVEARAMHEASGWAAVRRVDFERAGATVLS